MYIYYLEIFSNRINKCVCLPINNSARFLSGHRAHKTTYINDQVIMREMFRVRLNYRFESAYCRLLCRTAQPLATNQSAKLIQGDALCEFARRRRCFD